MATGKLVQIWRKRAKRGPMDALESAVLEANRGLVGNADQGRKRQVTIISQERWEWAQQALNATVPPTARRANLLISGIDLANSRKKVLQIGPCRILIWGETRPCERMDEAHPGLKDALDADWGGGAFGIVLDSGEISVGDTVCWLENGLSETEKAQYFKAAREVECE